MKKPVLLFLSLLAVSGVAYAASDLLTEFNRRDALRLTQEQGNVVNFLKQLSYPVEKLEEIEVLNADGAFVTRDREDILCMGNPLTGMLRCKNKAGISTVLYEGDAD